MITESAYLNPYSAFKEYVNTNIPLASQLPAIRKKLLAEIEFSDSKSIFIEKYEFTKDSLLKFFEQLKNNENNEYYLAILSDINLSNFLSQNESNYKLKFLENSLYGKPSFIEFISPYYKKAFIDFVIQIFNFPNYRHLDAAFNNLGMMTPNDKINAYSEILESLNGVVKRIEMYDQQYSTGPIKILSEADNAEIIGITSMEFIYCINSLPHDFSSFVRDYSTASINLSVNLPSENYSIKKEIIDNLFLITVDEDLKKIIRSNYFSMKDIAVSNEPDYLAILRYVVIGIIVLMKFSQC